MIVRNLTHRAILGGMALMLALDVSLFAQRPTPPPAQKGGAGTAQVYDVEFVLDGQPYTGTMTLKVSGTEVTGPMRIDQPFQATGDVSGTLKENDLSLDYAFQAATDPPCSGRVVVAAKMSADRSAATGTARASGCGDTPVEGSFSLKKHIPDKKE